MRCREALDRLNQPAPFDWQSDTELLEHLKTCPACARQAEVARELRQAFAEASVPDEADDIGWPEQIHRVETAAGSLSHQPKETLIMSTLKRQWKLRPKLSAGIVVAAIVLLAAAVIPFKFDQTVGFEVAVAGVNRDLALNQNRLDEFLKQLGLTNAKIHVTGCDSTCRLIVSSLESPVEADLVARAFEEIANVDVNISLNEVTEEVSGTVITHAIQKIFVFEGGDGLTPARCDSLLIRIAEDTCLGGVLFVAEDSLSQGHALGATWVDSAAAANGRSPFIMQTMHVELNNDSAGSACALIQPDQIVNGRLTPEARAALEAQGYTVEETSNADGTLTLSLTRNDGGKSENVVFNVRTDTSDSLAKESTLPEGFELSQNYPNPFNPETTIGFTIPKSEHVTLDIFNINGQKVRTLVDEVKPAGQYSVRWNATSNSGERVASGVYLYRLTAGEYSTSRKMTLLK